MNPPPRVAAAPPPCASVDFCDIPAVAWVPPIVPDFELLRRIGRGSYGDVWLARSITGKWRAVKVVYRDRFESDRPFEREFLGVRQFESISHQHPSHLRILHVGRPTEGAYFYYVMELADDSGSSPATPANGEARFCPETYQPHTLRTRLQSAGRIPAAEALALGVRLAEALHHLHRARLIHRDIKPSNIVFVDGHPKLADIGLVTAAEVSNTFVGTEGFVPPEGPGSMRADIFALGRVLYEAATGRDRLEFPGLPEHLEGLPDRAQLMELNQVWLKACDPDPPNRYANAEDLAKDLLLVSAGRSVQRWRWVERRLRLVTGIGAAIAALAAVAIVMGLWANRERLRAVQAEHDLHQRFVGQQAALARATRLTGLPGQRLRSLEMLREAARLTNTLELRNEAIAAMALPDLVRTRTLAPGSDRWMFDPSLTRYAVGEPDGRIDIRSLDDQSLVHQLPPYQLPGVPSWLTGLHGYGFGSDGTRFAAAYTNHDFLVWRLPAKPGLSAIEPGSLEPSGRIKLPWGARSVTSAGPTNRLYTDAADGRLHWFDLSTGQEGPSVPGVPALSRLEICPDGRRFAQADGERVVIRDLDTGATNLSWSTGAEVHGLRWHPDGLQLLTRGAGPVIHWWTADDGRPAGLLAAHEAAVMQPALDRDGQWMISTSWGNRMVLSNLARKQAMLRWIDGGNDLQLAPGGARAVLSSWQDNLWHVFDFVAGDEVTYLAVHPHSGNPSGNRNLWRVTFLDNGLLAGTSDHGFNVWDLHGRPWPVFFRDPLHHALFPAPGGGLVTVDGRALRLRTLARGDRELPIRQSPVARLTPREFASVHGYAVSHDLRQVAILDHGGELHLRAYPATNEWRALTPELVHSISMDGAGRRLAAIFLKTKGLAAWSTESHKSIFAAEGENWSRLELSPDGRWLAAASLAAIKVWDLENGRVALQRPRQAGIPPQLAWSPDSGWLLVNEIGAEVRLLAAETWTELATFPAPPLMTAPAFSLDGSKLALPGEEAGVQVWHLDAVRHRLQDLGLDWPDRSDRGAQARR